MLFSAAVYGSAVVFAAGFFSATALMARPATQVLASADISDLWTASPTPVARGAEGLERIAALTFPKPAAAASRPASDAMSFDLQTSASADMASAGIDTNATGAIAPDAPQAGEGMALSAEHLAWCERRYRSYSPDDNSYRSYSGSRRSCLSPFMQQAASEQDVMASDQMTDGVIAVTMTDASQGAMAASDLPSDLSGDHIRRCSARYASYRAIDNTYRSYEGDRRACILD